MLLLRQPMLVLHPRFWAEEATVYFAYAYNHSFLAALLSPHQGYYSLLSNLSTALAAHLVPLAFAPSVTTWIAFFVQSLAHLIIWFGANPSFFSIRRKIIASLTIIFVGYNCELQLNIIHAQFHLSLAAFLLLLEPWSRRSSHALISLSGVLLLAVLNGVVSCFLAPLYAYKYSRHENRTVLGNALISIMVLGSALQLLSAVVSYNQGSANDRFRDVSAYEVIASAVGNTLGSIIMGASKNVSIQQETIAFSPSVIHAGGGKNSPVILRQMLVVAALTALLILIGYFILPLHKEAKIIYVGGFFLLLFLPIVFSVHSAGGMRYGYVPCVIFLLMAQENLTSPFRLRRQAAIMLIIISLLTGAREFFTRDYCYLSSWPTWDEQTQEPLPASGLHIVLHPQWSNAKWFIDLPNDKAALW